MKSLRESIRTRLSRGSGSPATMVEVLEAELEERHPSRLSAPAADERERWRRFTDAVHNLDRPRSALCLSGGGIRSATLGLGLLQGLARLGLLERFDFLSTVSGGGYVGSWLSAWIARQPEGVSGVQAALAKARDALEPEPEPLSHLRAYSNYLTPRVGLGSADTWAVIATVLRNLFLNWLLLAPLLMLALSIPRWWLAVVQLRIQSPVVMAAALVLTIASMAYIALDLPSLGNRQWQQRGFMAVCLAPLFASTLLAATYWYSNPVLAVTPILYVSSAALLLVLALVPGLVFSRVPASLKERPVARTLQAALGASAAGGLAGLGLWLLLKYAFPRPAAAPGLYVCLAPPAFLALLCAVGGIFVGLTSKVSTDQDREWWARAGGFTLRLASGWLLFSGVVLLGPLLFGADIPAFAARLGKLLGTAAAIFTAIGGFSGKSSAPQRTGSSHRPKVFDVALTIAAPLAIVFLLAGLSALTAIILESVDDLLHVYQLRDSTRALADLGLVTGGLLLLAAVMGVCIDVNKFSLHSFYRNRLIRAYLGASRTGRVTKAFAGFQDADNIDMANLSKTGPFHLLNLTLNLVGGPRLAWQQRKAVPFTVSRLHAGSGSLAARDGAAGQYRKSARYADGITLGTAAAISGAAASPNMGYHSSPVVTFLMTVFNARLGWWLGNPGSAGWFTWRDPGPIYAVAPLITELLGLTNERGPYVYLSDGGHFENLGLYEVVRRRCHLVVVCDAGCDPDSHLEDLGNAVRKIRIDLGVPITFTEPEGALSELSSRAHFAIGRIHYDKVDANARNGLLVYIKPRVLGREAADVRSYRATHDEFPHESTADQWFTEAQFESYRELGQELAEGIFDQKASDKVVLPPELIDILA